MPTHDDVDSRVVKTEARVPDVIANLLRFDGECRRRRFEREMQTCDVCFEERLGSEFVLLTHCGHFFCRDCLKFQCEMHTKEGSVQSLKSVQYCPSLISTSFAINFISCVYCSCPGDKCKEVLPQSVIRSLLSEEEFERYERLHLMVSAEFTKCSCTLQDTYSLYLASRKRWRRWATWRRVLVASLW